MNNKYMRLALNLAKKGTPAPNPYVGAVIVKNRRIIGKGYHKRAGTAHAEIQALKSVKNPGDAKGATIYVNIEPCNHYGKTPPCVEGIIKSGIKKVVFAMKDPNPNVKGNGEKELIKHRIKIEKGILENKAKKLNEVFIKYVTTKIPFVVLKTAMSMDGKIATKNWDSKWITGKKAREYAHCLRSKYDAILVGINTVLKDNPRLTARIKNKKNPLRIVLDSRLRIPLTAHVLKDKNILIATSKQHNKIKKKKLEKKGISIFVLGEKKINIKKLLKKLGKINVSSILVEGGSKVQGSFIDQRLVDKVIFFYAPKIIGGKNAKPAIGGKGASNMKKAIELKDVEMKRIGQDFIVEAYPVFNQ